MKLLHEGFFKAINLLKDDTITFTINSKDGRVFSHIHHADKDQVLNFARLYFYEEYEEIKDCYVWITGYKENLV